MPTVRRALLGELLDHICAQVEYPILTGSQYRVAPPVAEECTGQVPQGSGLPCHVAGPRFDREVSYPARELPA
jgi:hypothetical protein